MKRSFIEIILEGTKNPMIARNWHCCIVPALKTELVELTDLHSKLCFVDEDSARLLGLQIDTIEKGLSDFEKKWPAPKRIEFADSLGEMFSADDFKAATFMQSPPLKNLVFLGGGGAIGIYIYKDGETNTLYKVPAIHYNAPGKRFTLEWSY